MSHLPSPFSGLPPADGSSGDHGGQASAFPSSAGPSQQLGTAARRYAAAIARRKWIVVLVTLLGAGAGFASSRHVAPEYLAQAMLWMEVQDQAENRQGPIRSGELLQSYAWVDLLKAYTVLDHVVREQRLYLGIAEPADSSVFSEFLLEDEFRPGDYRLRVEATGRSVRIESPDGSAIETVAPGEPVGRSLGFDWIPPSAELTPGRTISFSVANPRDVARRLSEQLETQMAEHGNFLRLELTGTDPVLIAAILNGIAERYVAVAADLKTAKLNELTRILDEQLVYAERSLRDAEVDLENFRVATITLPSDAGTPLTPGLESTRDPVLASFFQLKIERERLRREREAIDRALTQARDSTLSIETLEAIPAVRASSELTLALGELTAKRGELRAMRARYTDAYAPLRRLAEEVHALEHSAVPDLARALAGELIMRERDLGRLVDSAAGDLSQIPLRTNEEARLRRQVAVAEQLFTNLRQRYEAARLAAASSIPDVRILDRAAVPQRPVEDGRLRIIALAILGSLGFSLFGVILMDRVDRRFHYPDEVTHGLGVPILGAVADAGTRNGDRTPEQVTQILEAFREIRLNVAHAYGRDTTMVITVTSPASGDGKSFTTANLALAFADLQKRTLVVDGDIRRGTQHRLLKGRRKPGLTDYLAQGLDLSDVIQTTAHANLDFIGFGTSMQAGPELLSSARSSEMLEQLKARYDVILLDSPPLGAGVDALILGTLAGSVILVLRAGATDRELASAKLDLLERLPLHLLGAVLNAVPATDAYSYYAYISGYGAQDEPAAKDARTPDAVAAGP